MTENTFAGCWMKRTDLAQALIAVVRPSFFVYLLSRP